MTNLQALKSKLINNQKTDDDLVLLLDENGYDSNDEYKSSDKFNNMIAFELFKMYSYYQKQINESGYSVTFDMQGFKDYIIYFFKQSGLDSPFMRLGNITNKTSLW